MSREHTCTVLLKLSVFMFVICTVWLKEVYCSFEGGIYIYVSDSPQDRYFMQVLGHESLLLNDHNSPTKMECFLIRLVVVQTSDFSGWMEFEVPLFEERHRSFLWRERVVQN